MGGIHAQAHPALCVSQWTHQKTKVIPGFRNAFCQPGLQVYGLENIVMECIENILWRGEDWLLVVQAKTRELQLLAILENRNQLPPSVPVRVECSRNVYKRSDL